jgi:hypothetical protein
VVLRDPGDHGVETGSLEDRPLAPDAVLVDHDQLVDLRPTRASAAVPAAGTDRHGTVALVLRRQRNTGEAVRTGADDHDRPVLALRRVVLVGHPRPHDLTGVGIAVDVG